MDLNNALRRTIVQTTGNLNELSTFYPVDIVNKYAIELTKHMAELNSVCTTIEAEREALKELEE